MTANGTAIRLVGVTRRSSRPVNCPVRPGKLSRCKEGMAQFLPSQGRLLSSLCFAVHGLKSVVDSPFKIKNSEFESGRGILSRYSF